MFKFEAGFRYIESIVHFGSGIVHCQFKVNGWIWCLKFKFMAGFICIDTKLCISDLVECNVNLSAMAEFKV